MRTLAVLPVKTFSRAKQRLGDAVAPADRVSLAEAMVGDVLEALAAVPGIDRVVVVTAEPLARRAALAGCALVIADPHETGQSAAAGRGVRAALDDSADRVLLVPGDCPALHPFEVQRLLDTAAVPVTIVPDRHGSGTNALLLAPPDAIAPAFGPGSFDRHCSAARAAAIDFAVAELHSLGLDVDTPDDLAALAAALAARPGGAPRTRAALAALSFAA